MWMYVREAQMSCYANTPAGGCVMSVWMGRAQMKWCDSNQMTNWFELKLGNAWCCHLIYPFVYYVYVCVYLLLCHRAGKARWYAICIFAGFRNKHENRTTPEMFAVKSICINEHAAQRTHRHIYIVLNECLSKLNNRNVYIVFNL